MHGKSGECHLGPEIGFKLSLISLYTVVCHILCVYIPSFCYWNNVKSVKSVSPTVLHSFDKKVNSCLGNTEVCTGSIAPELSTRITRITRITNIKVILHCNV